MDDKKRKASRKGGRWVRGGIKLLASGFVIMLLVGGLLLATSLSRPDIQRFTDFVNAAHRWQSNPDFRDVQGEYVTLSNAALSTHPFGRSPSQLMLDLRSLPGLPDNLRVNAESALHYSDFTAGRLTAYLRLCREQGVGLVVQSLEDMGRDPNLSDARIRAFLDAFKLDWPVAHDAGAIASVRRLLADTDAARPFSIRETIGESLRSHVDAITSSMNWPQDIYRLTNEQQNYVLDRLDEQVKRTEPELWRTKQISDFLSGIWGQSYGVAYAGVMHTFLVVHSVAEYFTPALACLMILYGWGLRLRSRRLAAVPGVKLVAAGPPFS